MVNRIAVALGGTQAMVKPKASLVQFDWLRSHCSSGHPALLSFSTPSRHFAHLGKKRRNCHSGDTAVIRIGSHQGWVLPYAWPDFMTKMKGLKTNALHKGLKTKRVMLHISTNRLKDGK
jgi:hypothetical protein